MTMNNLKLASSQQYPTRKISNEGLEAIRAFLSARSAMYRAITDIEYQFNIEIDPDNGEKHLFSMADVDFVDWGRHKELSLERANEFIQKLKHERPIDDISIKEFEAACQEIVDEFDAANSVKPKPTLFLV